MCTDVRVNDFGTIFRATIKDQDEIVVNISSAIQSKLNFKNPNGTLYSKNADLYTDGTDGIIEYISESGLFSIGGKWEMQGYVLTPAGQWNTNIVNFFVQDNLE